LGYAYAHWMPPRLGRNRQLLLHLAVVLLPLLVLPVALPETWFPSPSLPPVLSLLGYLAAIAGLPFFVLSTTTPLLQRWFADTGHARAEDPYFLYAASNVGSFVGLFGYPLLIEPELGLRAQAGVWAAGYGLLILLLGLCAYRVWRGSAAGKGANAAAEDA